jgi:acyl CoA:acetate/3-ketoacid CoA transferase beta subunit
VITDMAVMDFEPRSRRMRVLSLNPGRTFADVQEHCGFELLAPRKIFTTRPPTSMELAILRDEIDPHRRIIGR